MMLSGPSAKTLFPASMLACRAGAAWGSTTMICGASPHVLRAKAATAPARPPTPACRKICVGVSRALRDRLCGHVEIAFHQDVRKIGVSLPRAVRQERPSILFCRCHGGVHTRGIVGPAAHNFRVLSLQAVRETLGHRVGNMHNRARAEHLGPCSDAHSMVARAGGDIGSIAQSAVIGVLRSINRMARNHIGCTKGFERPQGSSGARSSLTHSCATGARPSASTRGVSLDAGHCDKSSATRSAFVDGYGAEGASLGPARWVFLIIRT